MPTYNRAYIIGTAIRSLMAQTRGDWELIIMDDGSTDTTEAVVRGFNDERLVYLRQANAGPAVARNNAVLAASAKWVAYLDSDNEFMPEYVEMMLSAFGSNPEKSYGIPQGHYTFELFQDGELRQIIDKSGQFPPELTIQDIFHRKLHFDMNGFMHRRELLANGIAFDPELHGMEDWDLVMQMGERYPEGFLYVPKILYAYHQRYGTDSMVAGTGVSYGDHAIKFEQIYAKHGTSSLMQGQAWYPERVERWNRLEAEFRAGKLPPAYLYPFPDFWPK